MMQKFIGQFLLVLGFIFSVGASVFAQPSKPVPKVAMIQLDVTVGDYDGIIEKVRRYYLEQVKEGATIVVLPEMLFPGYPPGDLLSDRPEVLERSLEAAVKLGSITQGHNVPLAFGHIDKNPSSEGRLLQNTMSIYVNGERVFRYAKQLLPTYNVFDEARYFEPGSPDQKSIFEHNGIRYGIGICEDFWRRDKHDGRFIYGHDPLDVWVKEKEAGRPIDVAISLSSSPYTKYKREYRHEVHAEQAIRIGAPIVWVNQVGATDSLVFDGSSFVVDAEGSLVGQFRAHEEKAGIATIGGRLSKDIYISHLSEQFAVPSTDPEMEIILQTILTGIREYVRKSGQKRLVLGLSGGIDSTVTAALAALAIGGENVVGVMMPSKFSPSNSVSDAIKLAKNFGIRTMMAPIENSVNEDRDMGDFIRDQMNQNQYANMKRIFRKFIPRGVRSKIFGESSAGVADENIQARQRMKILYYVANLLGDALVLTTGCKSELAMGWCTKFGDHAGDLNPVGDLWKTEEIALGHYINKRGRHLQERNRGGRKFDLIPPHILEKRPSPDLAKNQFTDQTIPPYWILDKVLEDYMIGGMGVEQLTLKYGEELRASEPHWPDTWVQDVIKRYESQENKRDVAAVIIRVSRRAFSQKHRRVPVTSKGERGRAPVSCEDGLLQTKDHAVRTARP